MLCTERADGDADPRRVGAPGWQHAVTGARWLTVAEPHGAAVFDGRRGTARHVGPRHDHSGADVIVTEPGGPTAAIWAGDCAPLVLVAPDGTTVVAHAGWRGIVAGVVDRAVDAVLEGRSSAPALEGGSRALAPELGAVWAVLGPTIRSCCYEFGRDDAERVAAAVGVPLADIAVLPQAAATTVALDPPRAVAAVLARRGIALERFAPCTGCDRRWFSHRVRRDGGRHAVVVRWTIA